MNHNECKELIPFYLYEELDPEKKKLFDDHLKSCKDCTNELESYKNLFADISEDSKYPIDPKLLLEARLELRGAFRAQQTKTSISTSITNYFTSFIYKPVGLAISGLSVMLTGLVIGYLIFNSPVI
ncbi:MAG TPA: zf-HC2 domain-containing protein [Ignavibacteriaceae bacterium]